MLNAIKVEASVGVMESALEMLRREFDLGGAKLACGEGECGACTIIVDGRSRNSCLVPAVDLDGREV
ncbi:MAG: 2Fe-2S iron-sulfur cluster binding domain-containing protein, partial [Hyphomicrobiales bacterium]|nr:2Fe-2S iron-sulfur cluster binding domain-containing protein [Hyphomicrobiales bacterium]